MRARGFEATPIAPEIEAIENDDWKARTGPGPARQPGGVRAFHRLDRLDLGAIGVASKPRARIAPTSPDSAPAPSWPRSCSSSILDAASG